MFFFLLNNLFNKKIFRKGIIKLKLLFIIINIYIFNYKYKLKKKVGIIGLKHSRNIGNNLLKYAISIKLSEIGFEPFIIGKKLRNHNISFIQKNVKLRLINNSFNEIKKADYDILMVNSDQTWRKWDNDFYDIAFLKFAKKWNIIKFIYGTSLGYDNWKLSKNDEKLAKYFTISRSFS